MFENVMPIIFHIINIILWGAIIFFIYLAYRFLQRKLSK